MFQGPGPKTGTDGPYSAPACAGEEMKCVWEHLRGLFVYPERSPALCRKSLDRSLVINCGWLRVEEELLQLGEDCRIHWSPYQCSWTANGMRVRIKFLAIPSFACSSSYRGLPTRLLLCMKTVLETTKPTRLRRPVSLRTPRPPHPAVA